MKVYVHLWQYLTQYSLDWESFRTKVVEKIKTHLFYLCISVFNQLDAQNLFHNKFYFMPLHVSNTCAYHQEVKIALHSIWYYHTYRCDDTR